MNTESILRPPQPMSKGAAEDPVIAVRMLIPENEWLAPLYPANNRAASKLLCGLLRKRIEASGIVIKSSDYAFPFNSSFYLFTVAQRPAGRTLTEIQDELAALGLLDWAQIAWRDRDELIWRLYHPKSGVFARPSEEDLAAELRLALEMQIAIAKRLKRYGSASQ
jgi:hypothetical protein